MIEFRNLEKFSHEVRYGFKLAVSVRVNPKEARLLMMLKKKPGQLMKDYGRDLQLERGSFTYLVDRLEEKDLAIRIQKDLDRRSRTLALTEKGEKLAEEIEEQHNEYIKERLSCYSEEELKELEAAVETINNLYDKLPKLDKHRKHMGPEGRRPHPRHEGRPRGEGRPMKHHHRPEDGRGPRPKRPHDPKNPKDRMRMKEERRREFRQGPRRDEEE